MRKGERVKENRKQMERRGQKKEKKSEEEMEK